jgi:hypothetical protein
LTEPVVVWYGEHKRDYEALTANREPLASANGSPGPDGYVHHYEVSDPGGRRVLGIHIATRRSRLPHAILAPDGTPIATIERGRLRFRVRRPILAGDTVIGSAQDRRIVARRPRTIIDDPMGRRAAVSRPCTRSSVAVAYIVEVHEFATPALRSVAVAAAILDDWTRDMWDEGYS